MSSPTKVLGGTTLTNPMPPTKPPSARPTETRKSQLIRTYTSLLRSCPVILLFQHSNLTATEWAAVRRELKKVVAATPTCQSSARTHQLDLSTTVQLQVLRTNMFRIASRIVEFHEGTRAGDGLTNSETSQGPFAHDLSQAAYDAIQKTTVPAKSLYGQLEPLMVGPLAALTLPAISPAHLAAALSVLAPVSGKFPAPTRRKNPGYHDAACQNGLSKLQLIGGRVDGNIFDQRGVNWVASIEGGLDGLRSQLVTILQGAGLGITMALEGSSQSIWWALEGRKSQLKEEAIASPS
ncbi:hypothetical protein CDD83_5799 [Cordyceps sp. RAO-2017]|nr:hypothetical protein CDD83_5799 [Cordyceps sp. RAO-2017]